MLGDGKAFLLSIGGSMGTEHCRGEFVSRSEGKTAMLGERASV